MRSALILTLTIVAACGDDGASDKPNDPSSLHAALGAARTAQDELCAWVDGCYPELVEADWCSYPSRGGTEGIQREWPEAAVDWCWERLHVHYPRTVLDYLSCLNRATRSAADCWAACPADDEADDCAGLSADGDEDCAELLYTQIPEEVIDAFDACEREHSAYQTGATVTSSNGG